MNEGTDGVRARARGRAARARRISAFAFLALMLGLGGCDTADLLKVDLPGNVTAEDVEDPTLAPVVRVSAIGDFEWAWDAYTDYASRHSDEYQHSSGNFTGRRQLMRDIPPELTTYQSNIFGSMHRARVMLESNYDRLEAFTDAEVPDRVEYQAEMRTYGGFVYVAFGEGFCGTPLDGDGVVRTPDELLELAVTHFTEALSLAGTVGRADLENAALIGRARAYLDLQQYADAITDATAVVEGMDLYATREYGIGRRESSMAGTNELETSQQATLATGYHDVRWEGVSDPRITAINTGLLGHNGQTIVWRHDKTSGEYAADAGIDVIVASYDEAQLIIAEASAITGDLPTAIDILDDFHTAAGIPGVTATELPTQDDVIEHVIEERRRQLFVTGGHRQRDHLRWRGTQFEIPYLGEPGSDHPDGVDDFGQVYGTTTCFPVAQSEQVSG